MIYTYECIDHGEFDVIRKIIEMQSTEPCPTCGMTSKKVITVGSGGVFMDDNPSWLASACETLLRPEDPPLKTRGEYKAYLKRHGIFERGGREV